MSRVDAVHALGRNYRIFIVDDQPVIRQALSILLAKESHFEVCGEAENESDALQQIESCLPDLVVVDVLLKNGNGISLISALKQHYPALKTLIWSMLEETSFAERALRAGASGYVSKEEPFEQVVEAVHKVLQNSAYLSPHMTSKLMALVNNGKAPAVDPVHALSNRELQVFEMVGQGLTTQQIALKLQVSPKTVESHRERIKQKLDLKNSTQLNHRATHWVIQKG